MREEEEEEEEDEGLNAEDAEERGEEGGKGRKRFTTEGRGGERGGMGRRGRGAEGQRAGSVSAGANLVLDSGSMCTMLYLASDSELPPCPDSTWEGGATFFVRALLAEEESLYRDLFTKRHVVYLGSSDGCGCAFHYSPDEEVFSPDGMPDDVFERCVADRTKRLDGLSRLHAFIHDAARTSDLELLIAWASDRPKSITRRSVTVDHFATYERGIDLPEKCLFEIARVDDVKSK